jgi:hypothetical protein
MSDRDRGFALTVGSAIFKLIFVPTTVHIPPRLLASAQRRATALGISRNRLIIRALERELGEAEAWSEEFLHALRNVDPDTSKAAADLLANVSRRRRSKRPPRL